MDKECLTKLELGQQRLDALRDTQKKTKKALVFAAKQHDEAIKRILAPEGLELTAVSHTTRVQKQPVVIVDSSTDADSIKSREEQKHWS